ncbi:MAG: choline/ethanolamine kinase family protein [Streptosporangiaceae bacterium]
MIPQSDLGDPSGVPGTAASGPVIGTGLAALLDKIPALDGGPRTVTELPGGLTNNNYKVTVGGASFVVRVSPPGTDLLSINRRNEYLNTVAAAEAGVGAPVIDYLPDDQAMVVGFIDGVTFTDDSFKAPGVLPRVANACRLLHGGPRFVNDFNMFTIQRGYLDIVRERGFRLPDGYLDFELQVEEIRRALAVSDEGTVPCNNDLLAANFIDDGERIWLIDYEYSGNNDPCFELGNIWSECHLTADELAELVTAYYGRYRPSRVARARLQGQMSRYGWTLWAVIQSATSEIDFDFWTWGMEKLDAAAAVFAGPEFPRLLAEAVVAD